MIIYEYPFHERIRTLLRLEGLFSQFRFFAEQAHQFAHHTALVNLFEIAEVAGRGDLRADILQETGRQRTGLEQFRDNPHIDQTKLDEVLAEIENLVERLMAYGVRFGQHLRDIEWLTSVRNRLTVPGGVCNFDVPSYHDWLHMPEEKRREDLLAWVQPLGLVFEGLSLVLRLLRDAGVRSRQLAIQGSYQYMFAGRQFQLMQLILDEAEQVVPEFSVNKYMIWIRLMTRDAQTGKLRPVDRDIPFELVLCST